MTAPSDATPSIVEAISAEHPEVRLIRQAQNRGRGFARATGVDAAAGRYVATVDADIVLPLDWLARCLEAIDSVDAVAGTAVPDGDVTYLYNRFGLTPKVVAAATDMTGSNAVYHPEDLCARRLRSPAQGRRGRRHEPCAAPAGRTGCASSPG